MKSSELSAEQLRRLCEQIAPARDYLTRLQARMAGLGWDANDPLSRAASQAHAGVEELFLLAAKLAEAAQAREVPRWIRAQGK